MFTNLFLKYLKTSIYIELRRKLAPYQPPIGTHYSQVELLAEEVKHIDRIMGKGGRWFKMFTQKNRLKYVWFNKERGVIELWGSHDSIERSLPIVERRINIIMSKVGVPHEIQDSELEVQQVVSSSQGEIDTEMMVV